MLAKHPQNPPPSLPPSLPPVTWSILTIVGPLSSLHVISEGTFFLAIEVSEVFCHLTSKCLSLIVQWDVVRALSPLQLYVSIKAGCETIVHSVSTVMRHLFDVPPQFLIHLIVLIDLLCLRKYMQVFHVLLRSAAMGPSQLFMLGMLSSLAAAA